MVKSLGILCAGLILTGEPGTDSPGARDPAATRAEYEAARAATGEKAEAQVGLALWCEAHGLTAERSAHLARALASDPDNPLARGLGGFVSYAGRWLAVESIGSEVRADAKRAAALAEYNARRDRLVELAKEEQLKLVVRQSIAIAGVPIRIRDPRIDPQGQLQREARVRALRAQYNHNLAVEREKLGVWCRSVGLETEALAEFATAVQIDSSLTSAWKHMGYVHHGGRWLSPEALAAEEAEAVAQRAAESQWGPLLRKWKQWLTDKKHLDEADAQLSRIHDPRAVACVMRILGSAPALHVWAVRILENIEGPKASEALATMAVFSTVERARANAALALKGRPEREYVQTLVEMMEDEKTYQVEPVAGPGSMGKLVIDSPRFRLTRTYEAPPVANLVGARQYVGYDINGLPVIIRAKDLARVMNELQADNTIELRAIEAQTAQLILAANLKAAAAQQWLANDIRDLEQSNANARLTNMRVAYALKTTVGAPDLAADDPDSWRTWWYDRIGYTYTRPPKVELTQYNFNLPAPTIMSCFAAGTPVRMLDGPRHIESIRAGDQVLSQSTATGALSFQVVRTVYRNPPARTVKLTLEGGEVLLPGIYHRFWLAGKGWAMARDLKAGDVLRARTGRVTVAAAEAGEVVPVFNLSVASDKTYFVGQREYLVHDNSLPEPGVLKPFDTVPALAVRTEGK
jgi:hypothetical protein